MIKRPSDHSRPGDTMTIHRPDRNRIDTPATRRTATGPAPRMTVTDDRHVPVHSDFRLVELNAGLEREDLCCLRDILRLTWTIPTDTFVTSDLPLLLTKLCATPAVASHATSGDDVQPIA